MTGLTVAVLVPAGSSPVTNRPRRDPQGARALEQALRLNPERLLLIHAGDPRNPGLRQYLGMGVARIDVIATPLGCDPYPLLLERISGEAPDLVVCGSVASDTHGSGLMPYLLAQDLDWPILASARVVRVEARRAIIDQALPGGRLRTFSARLPAVVTVDAGAPAPRQVAFGPALRGSVRSVEALADRLATAPAWTIQPARRRARPLPTADAGASAQERLLAATERVEKAGLVLTGLDPDAAAARIIDDLTQFGLFRTKPEDS